MLNDWEERRLAAIEHELSSDKELGRVLAGPTRWERTRLAVECRFYPAGYLLGAVTYATVAVGSSQRATLALAYLIAIVSWLVVEVRLLRPQPL